MQSIKVKHNVEMAHRLSLQPDSKCFQIHGHSWWVELELIDELDNAGMVKGLDFGYIKKMWRGYLDDGFDHHLCLNINDPLEAESLPGAVYIDMDPTVENMAYTWGRWAHEMFGCYETRIVVWEASSNAATWSSFGAET